MKRIILGLTCNHDLDFEKIAANMQKRIFAYLLASVHNTDVANDLVQETLITAYSHWQNVSFEFKEQMESWIFTIAKNKMYDHLREVKRKRNISENKKAEIIYNLGWEKPFHQTCVHEEAISYKNYLYKNLNHLISLLPQEQQDVIFMRIFEDLSFREISEKTKINLNTCISRFHYGIASLKKMSTKLRNF